MTAPDLSRDEIAERVLQKINAAGIKKISVRDLSRKHWAGVSSPDEAMAALKTLNDKGWVRRIEHPQGKGRPASPLFEVHPNSQVKYLRGGKSSA